MRYVLEPNTSQPSQLGDYALVGRVVEVLRGQYQNRAMRVLELGMFLFSTVALRRAANGIGWVRQWHRTCIYRSRPGLARYPGETYGDHCY